MSFSEHLTKTVAAVGLNMVGDTTGWAAPVCIVDAPSGFGEEIWTGAQPETVLTVPLGGATVVSEIHGFKGLRSNLKERRMALQAQGANDQYRCQGGTRFAHFYLRAPLVARVAEGLEAHAFAIKDLRHDLIMFKDDTLWRRLTSYAERSTCRREPASRIEMEARALLVVDRLIGAHHLGREANPLKGGLAPWQVRRTQDAMAAQLDVEISLDALAAVAGCSPTHFSRAFKQSVGVPPFAWLHERRMQRAKELLCENVLSLAEIALAVGFSAQPQFTTAFGKAPGATPGAWRGANDRSTAHTRRWPVSGEASVIGREDACGPLSLGALSMSDASPPDLLAKFGRLPDHAKTSARLTVSAAIWSGKPLDEPELLSSLPHPHHHVLSIALTRYRCEPMIDGRILLDREWRRGEAQLMKAGVLPAGVMKSDWRLLHLYIPHRLMADALEMDPGALELIDPLGREDDCLGRLGLELEQAVMEASVTSRLLFEATTLAIMARLARRWSNAHERVDRVARRGGLAPWQVRRTQDAMASQLDADLGLDDLAAIAGCSPTHFSRAFKQSVGVPPFEWLQGLRMERAKALLAENDLSLAEIALAVGFSAQPQFTTAFGKATGTTPGAWRRERRS